MKRTPLRRKTPLRAKAAPGPTSRPLSPGSGPKRTGSPNGISREERAAVMARDGECIARKLSRWHWVPIASECRNQWGDPQTPAEPLTYGHVRPGPGATRQHTRRWGVAECSRHNLEHWESAHADAVRRYLEQLYGPA